MNPITSFLKKNLAFRVLLACSVMLFALVIPAFVVQILDPFELPIYNHLFLAICIGAFAVIGVKLLRNKIDKGYPNSIGLSSIKKAIKFFFLGLSFMFVPIVITLITAKIFNWTDFVFNTSEPIVSGMILLLVSTFFTDALSEEIIFRGYIYSNLNEHFSKFKSSLITLVLFVLIPICVISIQSGLNIKGSVPLTGGYIINLVLFGAFMQYLRIIFKSIWVGVGFHLMFVHMNQFLGITNDRLIQFSESYNELPIKITLIVLIVLVFVGLMVYPFLTKRIKVKNGLI